MSSRPTREASLIPLAAKDTRACSTSDVSKEPDVAASGESAVTRFGRLDCVIANAGILRNQKITDVTLDDFHTMVTSICSAPSRGQTRHPGMQRKQGRHLLHDNSVPPTLVFRHAIYCPQGGWSR